MAPWLFYVFAAIAVLSSLGVIGQRNPMYSVLFLIGSFVALAGLYVGLDSPFVAVTQIVVYAGAIMVLFLFVVMLLNAPREDVAPGAQIPIPGGVKVFGTVLSLTTAAMLVWALSRLDRTRLAALTSHRQGEADETVRSEWTAALEGAR